MNKETTERQKEGERQTERENKKKKKNFFINILGPTNQQAVQVVSKSRSHRILFLRFFPPLIDIITNLTRTSNPFLSIVCCLKILSLSAFRPTNNYHVRDHQTAFTRSFSNPFTGVRARLAGLPSACP